jgi:hypothetical protein
MPAFRHPPEKSFFVVNLESKSLKNEIKYEVDKFASGAHGCDADLTDRLGTKPAARF